MDCKNWNYLFKIWTASGKFFIAYSLRSQACRKNSSDERNVRKKKSVGSHMHKEGLRFSFYHLFYVNPRSKIAYSAIVSTF